LLKNTTKNNCIKPKQCIVIAKNKFKPKHIFPLKKIKLKQIFFCFISLLIENHAIMSSLELKLDLFDKLKSVDNAEIMNLLQPLDPNKIEDDIKI